MEYKIPFTVIQVSGMRMENDFENHFTGERGLILSQIHKSLTREGP